MKIIRLDASEITINDEKVVRMMECITMDTNYEILIRNKKDTMKLSKKIVATSEQMRRQRYLDALANNDRIYLNSFYESLSAKELFKLLFLKLQGRF